MGQRRKQGRQGLGSTKYKMTTEINPGNYGQEMRGNVETMSKMEGFGEREHDEKRNTPK